MLKSFPYLFINGLCGPFGLSDSTCFKKSFRRHLMRFHDGRFVKCDDFLFWYHNFFLMHNAKGVAFAGSKSMDEAELDARKFRHVAQLAK